MANGWADILPMASRIADREMARLSSNVSIYGVAPCRAFFLARADRLLPGIEHMRIRLVRRVMLPISLVGFVRRTFPIIQAVVAFIGRRLLAFDGQPARGHY